MFRRSLCALIALIIVSPLNDFSIQAAEPVPKFKQKVEVGQFTQQVRINYTTDEGLPANKITAVDGFQTVYAGTAAGVGRFNGKEWEVVTKTETPVTALTANGEQVWFATGSQIYSWSAKDKVKEFASLEEGLKAIELEVTPAGLLIGTSKGLWKWSEGKLTELTVVNDLIGDKGVVKQFSSSSDHQTAIATSAGLILYHWDDNTAQRLHAQNAEGGWFLQDVRGVGFDGEKNLWVAVPQGVAVRKQGVWSFLTAAEGLPYNDFTGLSVGPEGDVWLGTKMGAVHYVDGVWEYRQGKRWVIHDEIDDLVVSETGDVWFATSKGLSRIEMRPMTLKEKADFFDEEIEKYNRRTEFGFVDAVRLDKPGDKSKVTPHDSDNDGLWTSMYGAAQCFAYAATKSPEAKKRADKAMKTIGFLSEVTQGGSNPAPYGFPARTVLPTSGRNPNDHDSPEHDRNRRDVGREPKGGDPLWKVIVPRWPTSEDGKWYWKTDTSSDELDGHYFFYGLYYDLVAETEEEKAYVRKVVDRISTHLIEHNFTLVDHDGKPTRWARFGPDEINTDYMTDLRGLNSVSMLSYLIVAEHVTGDVKYRKTAEMLLNEHNYFTNVLNPKWQTGPGDGNQSDDEMAFMCYYNLLNYEDDPRLRKQYQRSFARYFQHEQDELCPLFNFIFAQFFEAPKWYWGLVQERYENIVPEGVDTLKRFPLDRVNWRLTNSHRIDVIPSGPNVLWYEGRGYRNNGKVLPIDERHVNHWNHNPWRLDQGGDGRELSDGAAYLLPYYLGLYHGFIVEPEAKP